MAILGLGIDIVEIARVEAAIIRRGDCFAQRLLTNNELVIWERHQNPICFLAKRLAAKEAIAKAFGIGISNGLTFNQFEVLNTKSGKPYFCLQGKALLLAKKWGVKQLHITLADEKKYACATVIIEN